MNVQAPSQLTSTVANDLDSRSATTETRSRGPLDQTLSRLDAMHRAAIPPSRSPGSSSERSSHRTCHWLWPAPVHPDAVSLACLPPGPPATQPAPFHRRFASSGQRLPHHATRSHRLQEPQPAPYNDKTEPSAHHAIRAWPNGSDTRASETVRTVTENARTDLKPSRRASSSATRTTLRGRRGDGALDRLDDGHRPHREGGAGTLVADDRGVAQALQ